MPNSRPASCVRVAVFALAFIATSLLCSSFATAQETVLYSFDGTTTGASPSAGVILDGSGNIYGTAVVGGMSNCSNGCGLVFEVGHNSNGTWSESTLYEFGGQPNDGGYPGAPLVFDSHGNLFGTTESGGTGPCVPGGCGTVFELTPNATGGGWTERVLHKFLGGSDGVIPASNLVFDNEGNLYGTTFQGGGLNACVPNYGWPGCGTIFELSPNADGTWSESVLYTFKGGLDGMFPAGVVFDQAGNLFGTTAGGLSCDQLNTGCGTVFELRRTSAGWVKSTPYRFKGGWDGFGLGPSSNLALDLSGNLYGTTSYGGLATSGVGYGTVYQLTRGASGTWTETVLYRFTGLRDGCYPTDGITLDTAGNLYGFATACGSSQVGSRGGTAFKLTPSSSGWAETTLATFHQSTGFQPLGIPILDSSGNIYGTLSLGGKLNATCPLGCGAVFEVTQP